MSSFTVVLKGGLPWGFRLQGGNGDNDPIRISKINPNSKAYNEGLQVGDYLETVNGQSTENFNLGDTQQIIKTSSDQLLLELRRREPTTNGLVNGDIHHTSSNTHINSGAGKLPAYRSNNMDGYNTSSSTTSGWSQYGGSQDSGKRVVPVSIDTTNTFSSSTTSTMTASPTTQPISMKDFINHEADAVFNQSPSTIPKYKQSISLPMSPTSSDRSFSLQRQPLSPGSYQNQQMSAGFYDRATRPLDLRWGQKRHKSSMIQQWGTSKKDSPKTLYATKPASSYGVILPGADASASRLSPRLSPAGSRSRRMKQDREIKVDQQSQQFSQPPPQGQMAVPYYTPSRNVGRPVPQYPNQERNVPITILPSQANRNRSVSESDPYGFNIEHTLGPGYTPWQSGHPEPPKPSYGSGSYATLPVKRAPKPQPTIPKAVDTNVIPQNDGRFDYNMYSTLPTIKPLKSTKKIESSDNYRQNQNYDFSKPLWTNQDGSSQSSRSPFTESTHSASSTLTSSDSHDTIVSGSSLRDSRTPINVIHEEMKPIKVVHEESKHKKYTYQDFMRPQRALREEVHQQQDQDFMRPQRALREDVQQQQQQLQHQHVQQQQVQQQHMQQQHMQQQHVQQQHVQQQQAVPKQEEFIQPKRVQREQSKPQPHRIQPASSFGEVQEEIIVPQKKGDVQTQRRVHEFGSLPKTKSPSQKKDIGIFNTLPSKSSSSPSSVKPLEPVLNGNVTSHHSLGPLSPTQSPRPGVWSPGMKPSTFIKSETVVTPEPSKPDPSFSVKPVWTPGGSPSGLRKEFRPVKLNTNVKPVVKPKVSPVVKPEESFAWKPLNSPSTKDPVKLPSSAVQYQIAGAKLESLLPDAIENAPSHFNGLDSSFDSSKDDLHLPQTQSPYITLLQKSREIEQLGDISNLNEPVMVTNEGQFPKGAKYIGKVETVDGDAKHTDTYYTSATQQQRESSTHVIEQKPKIFDGIGPVDHEGVPLAFRKNIDEKNQQAWYKQMYKNLHKTEKKDEGNNYEPTYKFPEDISDTRSEEAKNKETNNNEVKSKVNPYRPGYEIPSRFIDESGYRSEPEGKSRYNFKNRSKSTSSDESRRLYNYPPPQVRSKIEVYRNQPRSIMEYEPGFSSIAFQEAKSQPGVRQRSHSVHSTAPKQRQVVHNPPIDKPGQFSNYTVGGRKQTQLDINDEPADKESYKRVQLGGEIPIHGLQKPAPQKPKKWPPAHIIQDEPNAGRNPYDQNTNMSNVETNNAPNPSYHKPITTSNSLPVSHSNVPSPPSGTQQTPTIKPAKLRMPRSSLSAAEQLGVRSPPLVKSNENGVFKHQTSDVIRLVPMSEKEKRRKEEDRLYRKQRLEQLYEEERKRKTLLEEQDIESRRHNDFYVQSMKSPIPTDRFNDANGMLGIQTTPPASAPMASMATLTVPAERRRGFQIQGKAKALYNFNAQNAREISFRKGDIIYLLRRIDKNWFEGERHGRVGTFPVNYVEVMTTIEAAQAAAVQAEGQGRVKYNFTAQSPVELSLRKGEYVTLLRSVDDNWYEGRSGNKQGIFPSSYVEIMREPSTPLVTPAPSVICTPMTGRGTPELLSPVGFDAPTPPPQPSPSAFNQPRFPPTQFNYRPQQQSPSALRSQSNPMSPVINQELEQRVFSQKSQLSPTQPKKQVTINTTVRQDDKPVINNNNKGYGVKSKIADDDLAIARYRAVYAYKPQNEDELELLEGDEVYVMEQCDDGWYVGTSGRSGNFGTFPGNYVQLICK